MSLIINSSNKSYRTNGKDYYVLRNPLTDGNNLKVKSYVISYDIDNINSINSSIIIDDGSQSFPVVITAGKYTYDQLATSLQASLNATTAGTFTVTFVDGKYNIVSSVPVSYKNITDDKSIWDMINITKDVLLSVNQGQVPNINYTNYLHINSFELTRFKQVLDTGNSNNSNILCSVRAVESGLIDDKEVDAPSSIKGRVISDAPHNYKTIKINPRQTITQVDIQLTDDFGNDISEYVQYSLEILVD